MPRARSSQCTHCVLGLSRRYRCELLALKGRGDLCHGRTSGQTQTLDQSSGAPCAFQGHPCEKPSARCEFYAVYQKIDIPGFCQNRSRCCLIVRLIHDGLPRKAAQASARVSMTISRSPTASSAALPSRLSDAFELANRHGKQAHSLDECNSVPLRPKLHQVAESLDRLPEPRANHSKPAERRISEPDTRRAR